MSYRDRPKKSQIGISDYVPVDLDLVMQFGSRAQRRRVKRIMRRNQHSVIELKPQHGGDIERTA